jgi:RNA polymerase sigma-70 factor (ECF subfamily)
LIIVYKFVKGNYKKAFVFLSNNNKRDFTEADFELLYRKSFLKAVNYCIKYVRDSNTSREIVQNAFVNLWERRETIDTRSGNPEYYLLTSVRNLAFNYLRNRKRETEKIGREISLDDKINIISLSQDPCDETTFREISGIIDKTIASLPEKIHIVFVLSREKHLTYPEIAKELGISVKTVEYRIGKALVIFRKKLAEYLPLFIYLSFSLGCLALLV